MELVPKSVYIDFLGKRFYAFAFSLALIIGSIALWIKQGEDKFGIDFRGGFEVVVKINDSAVNSESLRRSLEGKGLESVTVQAFEIGSGDYSIRLPALADGEDSKAINSRIEESLKGDFDGKYTILKTDFVGPTIGQELRRKGMIAMVISLAVILIYVTVRFEFAFALGAVVALFHDVIVATGVYLLAGFPLTVGALAAALTIVGYSVNDTIVIFDRVREEIFKQKNFELTKLMNDCVNAMLSRTIITSLLTLLSALSLLVLGGGSIADLSLFLVAGIITGSYSTIFIAAPVVLAWERFRARPA